MKIILTLTLVIILNTLVAQTNPGLSFGGSKDDKGVAMCLTNDGGFLLTGSTRSYGAGSEDIYLIKLNSYLQQMWSATFGGLHQDHARSIITTDEGIMILGDVWDGGNTRLGMYLSLVDTAFENQMVIEPNPAHSEARLILVGDHQDINRTMEITSVDGIMVKKYNLSVNNLSFDVSDLSARVYIYKITA